MSETKLIAYAVSDSTGKTAKHLMESAIGQFPDSEVKIQSFSFVRSLERIDEIIEKAKADNAIIAYTFVKTEMREHLNELAEQNNLDYIDMMDLSLIHI